MSINFIKNFMPEHNESEVDDIGFGEVQTSKARLIKKDGTFNIIKKGTDANSYYEYLLSMSWVAFFSRLAILYFIINIIFAFILLAIGVENIIGLTPGSFLENLSQSLYFSIQTFTTVGYGHMTPSGVFANLLSAVIAFSGLLTFALATGLFFARFSRPISHIIFSDSLVMSLRDKNNPSLQFRIANANNSQLLDVEARVTMSWIEHVNGIPRRRFQRLDLEIEKIFMFPLNWTLVHPINENSPLYKQEMDDLIDSNMELLVLIKAYDETYDHYIHNKKSYGCESIREGETFVTMYEPKEDHTILHLDQINDTIPE